MRSSPGIPSHEVTSIYKKPQKKEVQYRRKNPPSEAQRPEATESSDRPHTSRHVPNPSPDEFTSYIIPSPPNPTHNAQVDILRLNGLNRASSSDSQDFKPTYSSADAAVEGKRGRVDSDDHSDDTPPLQNSRDRQAWETAQLLRRSSFTSDASPGRFRYENDILLAKKGMSLLAHILITV